MEVTKSYIEKCKAQIPMEDFSFVREFDVHFENVDYPKEFSISLFCPETNASYDFESSEFATPEEVIEALPYLFPKMNTILALMLQKQFYEKIPRYSDFRVKI